MRDPKEMRKFVPQLRMRCSMPKRTVSYPETWLNWGTEESDQVWQPSRSWRLYGDGITSKVLWAWKLEKLIHVSSGNNFIFDTFRNFDPVKRFEIMITRGRPGSCNNRYAGVYLEWCAYGVCCTEIENWTDSAEITNMTETCPRYSRNLRRGWG